MLDDDHDQMPCTHVYGDVSSDGRDICTECGEVMPRWMDPDDCMDCGMCEWCVERSIAAAEDAETTEKQGN